VRKEIGRRFISSTIWIPTSLSDIALVQIGFVHHVIRSVLAADPMTIFGSTQLIGDRVDNGVRVMWTGIMVLFIALVIVKRAQRMKSFQRKLSDTNTIVAS
jgi:uncharacterized membrane protein